MRILMYFSIGFTAACAVGAYLFAGNWLLLAAALCLICLVPLFLLKKKWCKIAAVILAGCVVGFGWNWVYRYFYMGNVLSLDGQKQTAAITVTDYSYKTGRGIAADGKIRVSGKNYKVKFYIYEDLQLKPGDRVDGEFTFRYTAQGAKKDPTYHQGKGIYLLAYGEEGLTVTESDENAFNDLPARLRRQIGQRIDYLFPKDVAGFARALLLGDSSQMSYEDSTAFSVSGISHVIAVSGLHVSILCAVVAHLCFHRRHLLAIIGIPILFFFAAVAGFTPSVVRACIMQALVILSMVLDREYDPATALAFSALIILIVNPLTITAVSFQLSVACMVGIYAFSNRIHKYLISGRWAANAAGKGISACLLRMTVKSVSISFSVWILTTPLCAIHFGAVSIVSIFTNLLTVWLVSFIFCGIMFACAATLVWLPLASVIAWISTWPMRFIKLVASALSQIPYAAVYTGSKYIVMWLIFCYFMLALFALFRFKRPGLLICCMMLSLVVACGAGTVTEKLVTQRVTVLDVGQGQCIILKYNDCYYMVDCGGSYDNETADKAAEYLHSKGIFRLDGLILSHYDADHAGAALKLLSRVDVRNLYLPDIEPENETRLSLEAEYGDRIEWVDNEFAIRDCSITLFPGDDNRSGNESSICVLFQPENYDILILSDRNRAGELALMDQVALPRLELLVVGHHGSAGATSLELLWETMPQAAAISVGQNTFGHPSEQVIERLEAVDCRVYRTDRDGTIEFGR